MSKKFLIVIGGPTAVGKTRVSVKLAQYFDSPIINADSRQIYDELNIGVAKPSASDLKAVRHYLIGTRSVQDHYDVGMYEQDVLDLLNRIYKVKDLVILSGGSGLYIHAVMHGLDRFPKVPMSIKNQLEIDLNNFGVDYLKKELRIKDPKYYEIVDSNNPRRLMRALEVIRATGHPFSKYWKGKDVVRNFMSIPIFLNLPRKLLYQKINDRVDMMMKEGLMDEVENLYDFRHLKSLQTVGYQELFAYIDKKSTLPEAIGLMKQNSRRYAKRQITWFKKYLSPVEWSPQNIESIIQNINKNLRNEN